MTVVTTALHGCASAPPQITPPFRPSVSAPVLEGFTREQEASVNDPLDTLRDLKPATLRVDSASYRRNSTFKKTFGFGFGERPLTDWLFSRVQRISAGQRWTAAVYEGNGHIVLTDMFFSLDAVEKLYVLVHEARHADGVSHVRCPDDYRVVSARQPRTDLAGTAACDDRPDGAYGSQAALLYELYAHGLVDPVAAGLLYNTSISRIVQ